MSMLREEDKKVSSENPELEAKAEVTGEESVNE